MSCDADPLWLAIRDFPLDDANTDFPFSKRLARDHVWTDAHAERVVAEYRRFLYLMARADQTVTPSVEVDEAWHLHLSYTRSYWEGLCRIVGRPLHHDPTEGGPEEAARFREAYSHTLDRYRLAFGAPPPPDIWPNPEERFKPIYQFSSVQAERYWLVRRLWSRSVSKGLATLASVAAFFGGGFAGLLTGVGFMFPLGAFIGGSAAAILLNELVGNGAWALVLSAEPLLPSTETRVDGDGCGGCGGCGG